LFACIIDSAGALAGHGNGGLDDGFHDDQRRIGDRIEEGFLAGMN